MDNILKDVLSKVDLTNTLRSVTDKGLEKVAASAVGATVLDLGTLFGLFVVLELVDIFTRMVACSAQLYRKTYDAKIVKRRGSLLTYIRGIPAAHHWRVIDSYQLRDGFFSKTIAYFLIIFVGFISDQILSVKHIPQFFLLIFCGVLSCTEVLSIMENLDEAGIKIASELKALVNKRKEGIK